MMLSQKTRQLILDMQKKYPKTRSALIPALHLAQQEIGYLPIEIQSEVADLFNLDATEVNGVVSFYDMFFEEPVGKHLIHFCKNVSCMLRGADEIKQKLCDRLNIKPGETTADKEFTLIESECLAACDKAPMMLIDENTYGFLKESDLENILEEAKKGAGHPSPVEATHG